VELSWNDTKNVEWLDATGAIQTVLADQVVLTVPRPSTLDDLMIGARPVRKDSGEGHLDYLIITMENLVGEGDLDRPVVGLDF